MLELVWKRATAQKTPTMGSSTPEPHTFRTATLNPYATPYTPRIHPQNDERPNTTRTITPTQLHINAQLEEEMIEGIIHPAEEPIEGIDPPTTTHNTIDEADDLNEEPDADINEERENRRTNPYIMAYDNLETNDPYGDAIGLKRKGTTRLYCQNINGIKQSNNYQHWKEVTRTLGAYDTDIILVNETNTDWRSRAYSACKSQMKKNFARSLMVTASSRIRPPKPRTHQRGGVATIITDDYTSLRMDHGKDEELGRWSYVVLRGTNGRKVAIVSVYQLHRGTVKQAGPSSATAQQAAILAGRNRNIHPREALLEDLETLLQAWIDQDIDVIIGGDFNDVLGENNSFSHMAERLELQDTVRDKHGRTNEPATYILGSERLDYVLATPRILTSIKQTGILPYGEGIHSDHRGIFVDFDTSILFGSQPVQLPAQKVKGIKSKNSKTRRKYIFHLDKYLNDHKVHERLHRAETEEVPASFLERIDKDITQGMAYARKKAARVYLQPMSPAMTQAMLCHRLWNIYMSQYRTKRNMSKRIADLRAAIDHPPPPPETLGDIRQGLIKAKKHLKAMVDKAAELREEFLKEEILSRKLEGKDTDAKVLERVKRAEITQKMYRKLGYGLKPQSERRGVTRILVPSDGRAPKQAKKWKEITDQQEIREHMQSHLIRHFNQAAGTPFTIGNLANLQWNGQGEVADQILAGTYRHQYDRNDRAANEVVQWFIDEFKQENELPPISLEFLEEHMIGKYKNWKETTSTSPFTDRYLGQYQCLIRHILDAPPEEREDPNSEYHQAQRLLQIHHKILVMAVKYRHSYQRWKKVVNVMLEKDEGIPKIHRYRIIMLYEADCNLLVGHFWARQLIWQMEDMKEVAEGCYGNRKGLSAHDPIFLENLQISIGYSSRTNQATDDRDAAACYDRQHPGLVNLCARRLGMPKEILDITAQTLEESKYHISTADGIAEEHYSHTSQTRVYGTGQGSTLSPSAWALVCSQLFKTHKKHAIGSVYINPDGTLRVELDMSGFVDDTKGHTNDMDFESSLAAETLKTRLEHDAQLWSDLLWVAGGQLEHSKSYFYMMIWEFDDDGTPYLKDCTHERMELWNFHRTAVTAVKCKKNDESRRTLGVFHSLGRDRAMAAEEILTKTDKFVEKFKGISCTPREATVAYHSFFMPSIGYALHNSMLHPKILHQIMKKTDSVFANKMGFVKTFPRAVLYGPQTYGGRAMRDFTVEQTIDFVQMFMKHLRSNHSKCHEMSRIALEWAQHQVGTSKFLLTDVQSRLPHLEDPYIVQFREGLARIDGEIEMAQDITYPAARTHDRHIMDVAQQMRQAVSGPKMTKISYYRNYLQITTLSDMVTADGTKIQQCFTTGDNMEERDSIPTIKYPRQQSPKCWKQWRTFLRQAFCKPGRNFELRQPLGSWHERSIKHPLWKYYLSEDTLYERRDDAPVETYRMVQDQGDRLKYLFPPTGGNDCHALPKQAFPVQPRLGEWRGTEYLIIKREDVPVVIPMEAVTQRAATVTEAKVMIHRSLRQLIQNIHLNLSEEDIAHRFKTANQVILLGDGGARHQNAGHGAVVAIDGEIVLENHGKVYGDNPRSYRAESYAWAGVLLYLSLLHSIHDISRDANQSPPELISDNEGLTKRIRKRLLSSMNTPTMMLKPEADVEAVILDCISTLQMSFNVKWIKGHQDKNTPVENLSLHAQLNVRADQLATLAMDEDPTHQPRVPVFPSAMCHFVLDGTTITRNIPGAIRFHAGAARIRPYLMQRNDWTEEILDSIHWER